MKLVSFSLEQGNRYFAEIDGARFLVGKRVSFEGGKGLMNVTGTSTQRYERADYRPRFGFWADFIHPTAMAEGALFHTLNTYDRAQFTFSFLQYAAHVPDGDFVVFMRALLALPTAADYFPDLRLTAGRICRLDDDGDSTALESASSTAGLLDYLNPSTREVEDTEVIIAAKFVHWAQNDIAHREVQIGVGIAHIKDKLKRYARQYGLDGAADSVCLLVTDIRHQGRAKSPAIALALASGDPLASLLDIGEQRYPQRIATLRAELARLRDEGTLGTHRYSLAKQDFVLH